VSILNANQNSLNQIYGTFAVAFGKLLSHIALAAMSKSLERV
jgi:hypothetical protein